MDLKPNYDSYKNYKEALNSDSEIESIKNDSFAVK